VEPLPSGAQQRACQGARFRTGEEIRGIAQALGAARCLLQKALLTAVSSPRYGAAVWITVT
jgi:hypothetical protein